MMVRARGVVLLALAVNILLGLKNSKGQVAITPKPTFVQDVPQETPKPTVAVTKVSPTPSPTTIQTKQPITEVPPTLQPTAKPTKKPTRKLSPTPEPTSQPTPKPTLQPTALPTAQPISQPTSKPTAIPTRLPTILQPTMQPTQRPDAARPELCSDEIQSFANGETDTDCGGSICTSRCSLGMGCKLAADCEDELWCGYFADGNEMGVCVSPLIEEIDALQPCRVGEPCEHGIAKAASLASVCALSTNNESDTGLCIPWDVDGIDDSLDDDDGIPPRWTPASISSTVLLSLSFGFSVFLGDGFLIMQVLEVGQSAFTGALLFLPSSPAEYSAFASSLGWTMCIFSVSSTPKTPDDGRRMRRLNAIDEASNGVTYFADLAALNPSHLLCECLVVTIICTLAYIGVQVRKKGLTMWYACVREAGVRVPYLMAYPVMALSSYTLYLLFLTSRENDVAIRACLGLLAFGMFSLGVVWLHVGYRYTKQVAPSETFHSLTIDWKEHSRLFWIVRVLGNAFRGIFVGLITRPTPLQASLFMVVNTSYLLIIVYVRPYKYARTNQIAILGAVLCLANTTLLVIFATSPQPFSDSTMDELGKLQIGLTVLSFVFLLLVVMSQCFHRWREARNRNDQQGKADDLEGNMRSPSDSNKRMAADKMQTSFMDASSPPQSVRTRGRTSSTVVVGDKEEEDNGSDSEACRNSDSDVDDATAHDHAGSFGGVDAQGKVEEDVNHEDPDLSSSFVAAGTPSMAVVTPSLANEDEVKTHAQTSLTQR